MDTSCDRGISGIVFDYMNGNDVETAGRTGTDFLVDNALVKAEDLIPAEWLDYECAGADELLEVAGIFDSDITTFGELSSSSTTSASASASSPSSTSWVQTERHSSSCAASSTPSSFEQQEVTICADSATSSSYQSSVVLPLQSAQSTWQNEDGENFWYFLPAGSGRCSEKPDVLEELQNLDFPDACDVRYPFSAVPREWEDSGLDFLLPGLGSVGGADGSDELPKVFFEWLKNNRDCISPEDLRSIKLKRSTIENAAKRLAGEKNGMVHLLKLILAWVKDHHLQRKRKRSDQELASEAFGERSLNDAICTDMPMSYYNTPVGRANLWNSGPDNGNICDPFKCNISLNSDVSMFASVDAPALHPMKYRRIPAEDTSCQLRDVPNLVAGGPAVFTNPMAPECQAMVDAMLWQTHTTAILGSAPNHNQYPGLGSACRNKNRFAVQSPWNYLNFRSHPNPPSTTKEARKNRMARQRRSNMAHQHHHNRQWPSSSPALPPQSSEQPVNNLSIVQQFPRQAVLATDRRQGWAPEKNLKFLLQKVLKQSDVGNLGRIVLPKKEAEAHLPELEARDGITIAMEDIVTSRVWNMRYRFWPNNKSRMYLLENTGEFIRSNGLREGDFIVIYSDSKTGKYMIRGVKVPQSDTSGATATKSTTGSSRGDGEDSKLMNTGKSYGATTGLAVAVAFSDSMGDASSSVSDAARAPACDQDPFLKDPINEFPKNPAQDDKHHLERLPSPESGDLTIEEILDLVDSPHIGAESLAKLHETLLI